MTVTYSYWKDDPNKDFRWESHSKTVRVDYYKEPDKWLCSYCQCVNEGEYNNCTHCGAPRSKAEVE